MTNRNREAAIARIRALLSKTTANGATEAEALSAAAKAGELMDRYGVSVSDTEIRQETCQQRQASDQAHEVDKVAPAIARFCGCKVWRVDMKRLQYFGLPHDVEIAVFLTDLIRTAMNSELRIFRRSPKRPLTVKPATLRNHFMTVMANRLTERLDEMRKAREVSAVTASGTALVVVRDAVVTEQFAKLNLNLKTRRARRIRVDANIHAAARAAGDRVSLTTGINGANRATRIGA